MSRWSAALITALVLLPLLIWLGISSWALWQTGHFVWMWLLFPVFWGIALILTRRWRSRFFMMAAPETEISMHWTPRDREAWAVIEEMAKHVEKISPDQLVDMQFYVDTARSMALRIAHCYHPKAKDPLSSLTIPEILAATQLAVEDLAELTDRYTPGGHLLTVKHWRSLTKVPDWYRTLSELYWPISILFAPGSFVGRYAASRWVLTPLLEAMQTNLLAWFYVSFVHRVGLHVIEMNSGRLRGGAKRYRAAMEKLIAKDPAARPPGAEALAVAEASEKQGDGQPVVQEHAEVTIALAGQVKAGKSSLINALLGERKAKTDVLPETRDVARYQLEMPRTGDKLVLLDTAGYGVHAAPPRQIEETAIAFQQADLVLFVMDASSPAREPDSVFLKRVANWFEERPHLRPPPVVGVLTHIDMLRPVMEWSPPYDWRQPAGKKAQHIAEAVEYNREKLGEHFSAVVPVCTDVERGRIYGIEEWLLPAVSVLLGEARASALIRNLHTEIDRERVRRVFQQLRNIGQLLLTTKLLKQPDAPAPPSR